MVETQRRNQASFEIHQDGLDVFEIAPGSYVASFCLASARANVTGLHPATTLLNGLPVEVIQEIPMLDIRMSRHEAEACHSSALCYLKYTAVSTVSQSGPGVNLRCRPIGQHLETSSYTWCIMLKGKTGKPTFASKPIHNTTSAKSPLI